MSLKCVKMFCLPPFMYISLMNMVSTEQPVYWFSQASSHFPIQLFQKWNLFSVLKTVSQILIRSHVLLKDRHR